MLLESLDTVGSKIRYYRKLNNITIGQLSQITGLHSSTILRYENNQVDQSLGVCHKLAKGLGISRYLLYDDYLKFLAYGPSRYLKKLRKTLGITQRELAKICGVSLTSVKRWECGVTRPTREHIKLYSLDLY